MILMMEKDFKIQNDAINEFFNELRNSDLFNDKKFRKALHKDIINTGRSCFFAGLTTLYTLRCSALVEIAAITKECGDLSEDDVDRLLPYLSVVEKCCNIIDAATMEKKKR